MKRAWCFLGVWLAMAGAARAQPAPAPPDTVPTLGVLVAQTFLRALMDRDARTAVPLCAEAVDFDGEVVKGAAIPGRLQPLMARLQNRVGLRRIVVMTLARAVQLFGAPPGRLHLPKATPLLVAFGRLARGGLIVFLAPERDRWRVVALTD